MKKLLAISILSISASSSHASLATTHGDSFVTLINLKGLICAKVEKITPLKKADTYKVDCVEHQGGKRMIQYIIDIDKGDVHQRYSFIKNSHYNIKEKHAR